ncbi:MAG: alpha amylase C-terminal domain-containing protein [Clostridiaceae bacterium]|nr:alpha amylase C-terminal domain-containing protein [Clostridiaceae bacterium]
MNQGNRMFEYRVGDTMAFGVTKVPDGVQFAVYLPDGKDCFLKVYKKGRKEPALRIALTDKYKKGSVYFVTLCKAKDCTDPREIADILSEDYEYLYEADGVERPDAYADYITGRDSWGKRTKGQQRCGICVQDFSWGEDIPLRIPYSDLILYQLHVRGYTKHSSSKVKHKGTFCGLVEKIPHLRDLGINAVMLLPAYDFDELEPSEKRQGQAPAGENGQGTAEKEEPLVKVNYWGYGAEPAFYFAPKASYACKGACPSTEFKEMVKAFHTNGIEVLMDIYFSPGTNLVLMMDCLRSWVLKYHIDGFRVNQEVMPSLSLASDPLLSGVKILGNYWDINMLHGAGIVGRKDALAEYNEGFMNDARRFLKSDEGMVERVAGMFARNAKEHSFVNFITHVNGFTLMDLVSYDIKHNEENGEMNQDGTEFNYSWNCGAEGKTRKKMIMERRMTQIRNALIMLFTSQGTPMLLAGDEFGNTQFGNNNAYCQDNAISWIQWNMTQTSKEIYDFVKNLIRFRKSFPVLHQKNALRMMDTLSCGMPDLSIHGLQAWRPDYSNYSRMLAMLYYGAYVEEGKGRSVYVIYNMFWEPKAFDLPNLPNRGKWKVIIDSYDNSFDESLLTAKKKTVAKKKKKEERQAQFQRKTVVAPRSVVIFVEE